MPHDVADVDPWTVRVERMLAQLGLHRPLPSNLFSCRTDTWGVMPAMNADNDARSGDGDRVDSASPTTTSDAWAYFGESVMVGSPVNVAITDGATRRSVLRPTKFTTALWRSYLLLFPADSVAATPQAPGFGMPSPTWAVPLASAGVTDTDDGAGVRLFIGFQQQRATGREEWRQEHTALLDEALHQRVSVATPGTVVCITCGNVGGSLSELRHQFRVRSDRQAEAREAVDIRANWDCMKLHFPKARFNSAPDEDPVAAAMMSTCVPSTTPNSTVDIAHLSQFYDHVSVVSAKHGSRTKLLLRCRCRAERLLSMTVGDRPASPVASSQFLNHLSRHAFAATLFGVEVDNTSVSFLVAPCAKSKLCWFTDRLPLGPHEPTYVASLATMTGVAAQLALLLAHCHARGVVVGPLSPRRLRLRFVKGGSIQAGANTQWAHIEVLGVGLSPTWWHVKRKQLDWLAFMSPQYIRQWHGARRAYSHDPPRWQASDDWWSLGALLFWMRTGHALLLAPGTRDEQATSTLNGLLGDGGGCAAALRLVSVALDEFGAATTCALTAAATGDGTGAPLSGRWVDTLFPAPAHASRSQSQSKEPTARDDRPVERHIGLTGLDTGEVATLRVLLQPRDTDVEPMPLCDVKWVLESPLMRESMMDAAAVFSGAWPIPLLLGRKVNRVPSPASPLPAPPREASPARPRRKSASPSRSPSRQRTPSRQRVLVAALRPSPAVGTPPTPAVDESKVTIHKWLSSVQ